MVFAEKYIRMLGSDKQSHRTIQGVLYMSVSQRLFCRKDTVQKNAIQQYSYKLINLVTGSDLSVFEFTVTCECTYKSLPLKN